jgi:hypothetical protein
LFIKAPFGELALYLADFGYQPVPIGRGTKSPLVADWQAGYPVDHWLPRCATWGTGILCATSPGIDLDVRDKEIVRALIALADDMLGPTAFRIGQPPKALLTYSATEPFEKLTGRWFALPGDDWRRASFKEHRIEVLANGQQYVAYAVHPGTGRGYRWRRGEPMQSHRLDLPEIDEAGALAFLRAAQDVLREAGAVPLVRREQIWFPDAWNPDDLGEPEPEPERRRSPPGTRIDSEWQRLEPETLAKRIDAKHAKRLGRGGWITSCPAHRSEGHRSLSITPRAGGGSVVHCFAECEFSEIARAIADIVGSAG